MRHVWIIKTICLYDDRGESRLFRTNCKNLKFGEKLYISSRGYAQRRKTERDGWLVLKAGKNISMIEHFALTHKLRKKYMQERDDC